MQSVAEAYPAPDSDEGLLNDDEQPIFANHPVANDEPEDAPEEPTRVVPNNNKKTPAVLQDDDEEEDEPVRPRNRPAAGSTYFPVTFGSTNGGAIAIANSYSTGKGTSFI